MAASARWPRYKSNKIVSAKKKVLDNDDEPKLSKEQDADDYSVSPAFAKPNVMRRISLSHPCAFHKVIVELNKDRLTLAIFRRNW